MLGFGGANPTLYINGGTITTYTGTTHNIGVIHFNSGLMLGTPTPAAAVRRLHHEQHSFCRRHRHAGFDFRGGRCEFRGNIVFNVTSAASEMDISAGLGDEPGTIGGLSKAGPGLVVLSGVNSYTGGTAVNSGTLRVQNSLLPSSVTTVASGAVLEYSNSGNLFQYPMTYSGAVHFARQAAED